MLSASLNKTYTSGEVLIEFSYKLLDLFSGIGRENTNVIDETVADIGIMGCNMSKLFLSRMTCMYWRW